MGSVRIVPAGWLRFLGVPLFRSNASPASLRLDLVVQRRGGQQVSEYFLNPIEIEGFRIWVQDMSSICALYVLNLGK